MAQLTGRTQIVDGDTTAVDSTAKNKLGTRAFDTSGNEYIYLKGVASTAANDFVVYDEDFATTRLVGTSIGPVAVAMAATVADKYGWYLIYGNGTGNNGNTVSGGTALYASSVTAACDDLAVSGDAIRGAFATDDETVTGGGVGIYLTYPFIDQTTI